VWTSDGRPKYYSYDPTNAMGIGNAMTDNTAFPMAWMYNTSWLRPYTSESMLTARNVLSDKDTQVPYMTSELADLRDRHKRVTPITPDGVDPEKQQQLGKQLTGADTKMMGWVSAYAGPKFADAWNATAGRLGAPKAERTYLTPFADTIAATPGEMAADPINLIANLAAPASSAGIRGLIALARSGVRPAVTTAARTFGGALARVPTRMADDIARETAQDATVLGPALSGGVSDFFFKPQETNLLMGKKNPNGPDYDRALEQETERARKDQFDATRGWAEEKRRAEEEEAAREDRESAGNRPVAAVRFGDPLPKNKRVAEARW
jgi:hypothetical protein